MSSPKQDLIKVEVEIPQELYADYLLYLSEINEAKDVGQEPHTLDKAIAYWLGQVMMSIEIERIQKKYHALFLP